MKFIKLICCLPIILLLLFLFINIIVIFIWAVSCVILCITFLKLLSRLLFRSMSNSQTDAPVCELLVIYPHDFTPMVICSSNSQQNSQYLTGLSTTNHSFTNRRSP